MNAFPIELMWWIRTIVGLVCGARADFGFHPLDESPDNSPQFQAYMTDQIVRWRAAHRARGEESANEAWVYGSNTLKLQLYGIIESQKESTGDPETARYITDGVSGILAAMLSNAYAAFEALAADLWVCAVNLRPQLATNYIDRTSDKSAKMSELFGEGFDLRASMGTRLIQTKKANFQTFNTIKNSYQYAFAGAADFVFSNNSEIYKAEKIRHLLAHRAGLIDPKFVNEMKDYPEFADLKAGTYFELSGPNVCKNIDVCVKISVDLFKFVDDWAESNGRNGH